MANGKMQVLQKVLKKLADLEPRVKRMEKELFLGANRNSDFKLGLVAGKIFKEDAEMRFGGRKYLGEEHIKKKYGF